MERLGKFILERPLGRGGMGEVFLGRDPAAGRPVAVKVISRESALGAGPEGRERILREARAAGQASHPNLVTVHEFGEEEDLLYLVMEYAPGEDLAELMARGALSLPELLEALAQVCDGLAAIHAREVVHRDVKPSNIRVDRSGGQVTAKLMDFGVARLAGADFTDSGTLVGTFGYMAPEYVRSGIPTPQADLYAVGVILYEALAGRRPFACENPAALLSRIAHGEPDPLPDPILGVGPALRALVARAMARDPAERFPDAAALARALRKAGA